MKCYRLIAIAMLLFFITAVAVSCTGKKPKPEGAPDITSGIDNEEIVCEEESVPTFEEYEEFLNWLDNPESTDYTWDNGDFVVDKEYFLPFDTFVSDDELEFDSITLHGRNKYIVSFYADGKIRGVSLSVEYIGDDKRNLLTILEKKYQRKVAAEEMVSRDASLKSLEKSGNDSAGFLRRTDSGDILYWYWPGQLVWFDYFYKGYLISFRISNLEDKTTSRSEDILETLTNTPFFQKEAYDMLRAIADPDKAEEGLKQLNAKIDAVLSAAERNVNSAP